MTPTRYVEIADALAAELSGDEPGSRVASEKEIAARFQVGRAAARSALQELERRMIVRRVQGAGTFLNRRIDYRISQRMPPSWHSTVAAAGAQPRAVVKAVDRVPMPEDIAALLDRRPGEPVYQLARELYIDEFLASWVHEWVAVATVPELNLALHVVDSLDVVLRQMGRVEPVRAWCRVSLDTPGLEVQRALDMDSRLLAWQVDSLSRDARSGEPVMCSTTWTRLDAVRIVVEMDTLEDKDD